MAAVQTSLDTCSTVYCPIGLQAMPWINMAALLNYIPDPVRIVVEKNEVSQYFSLVFLLLTFYSFC